MKHEFKINPEMGDSRSEDKDILRICKNITEKGYVTQASCEGHPHEDFELYYANGNLYWHHNAYIAFDKKYNFSDLPCGWEVETKSHDLFSIAPQTPLDYSRYIKVSSTDDKTGENINNVNHMLDAMAVNIINTTLHLMPSDQADDFFNKLDSTINEKRMKLYSSILPNIDGIISICEALKEHYMSALSVWAETLPENDDSDS